MRTTLLILLLFLHVFSIAAIKITEIRGPEEAVPGTTVTLSCDFDTEGEKLYSLRWYFKFHLVTRYLEEDGHTAHFSSTGLLIDEELSERETLVIPNVTLEASGLYTCEVSTDASTFEANNHYLSVRRPHTLVVNKIIGPKEVARGTTVTLICDFTIDRADNLRNVYWYFKSTKIVSYYHHKGETKTSLYPGLVIDTELSKMGTLVLQNVTTTASGMYRCAVMGPAPKYEQDEAAFELSVKNGCVRGDKTYLPGEFVSDGINECYCLSETFEWHCQKDGCFHSGKFYLPGQYYWDGIIKCYCLGYKEKQCRKERCFYGERYYREGLEFEDFDNKCRCHNAQVTCERVPFGWSEANQVLLDYLKAMNDTINKKIDTICLASTAHVDPVPDLTNKTEVEGKTPKETASFSFNEIKVVREDAPIFIPIPAGEFNHSTVTTSSDIWENLVNSEAIFLWHQGSTLLVHTLDEKGTYEVFRLGDLQKDPEAQFWVHIPKGTWRRQVIDISHGSSVTVSHIIMPASYVLETKNTEGMKLLFPYAQQTLEEIQQTIS